jgi:uncharacterized delta-60 repeat protein
MVFALFSPLALAADGDVDLSFGGGQVTIARPTEFPTAPTPTGDVLGLADGAYLWIMANQDSTTWIGRTLHDGRADTAFGSEGTGRVTLSDCIDFTPTFLADDGAGGAFVWTGACIVHVEPDGSLDAGFGGVPIVDADYYVVDFARDASGRFVFAATTGQTWDVLRYEADGATPDATFGVDGHVRIDVGATNNLRGVNALAVRDDGRIVTAGWRGNEHGPNLVVAQLTETGELDPAWNGGAVVASTIEPSRRIVTASRPSKNEPSEVSSLSWYSRRPKSPTIAPLVSNRVSSRQQVCIPLASKPPTTRLSSASIATAVASMPG